MIMSDSKYLNSAYTYISDDGLKMSWVNHVLTTALVDKVIGNFSVLNNIIVSDYKSVSFCMKCDVSLGTIADTNSDKNTAIWISSWQQCDEFALVNYRYQLDSWLHHVDVPWYLLNDQHVTRVL